MNEKDKLNIAFSMMRYEGLVARQNFSCCSSCAGYDLASDIEAMSAEKRAKVKGVCFYHKQDASNSIKSKKLYLGYGPVDSKEHGQIGLEATQVGHLVTSCLTKAGLNWEWDGDDSKRILVRF